LSLPSPAEKYCPREEKDIRRWKRDFPGKVLFHFSIPGIEKWKRTLCTLYPLYRPEQGNIIGRKYIKKFKKFCEPQRLMPF
jgi:hypothetical protein